MSLLSRPPLRAAVSPLRVCRRCRRKILGIGATRIRRYTTAEERTEYGLAGLPTGLPDTYKIGALVEQEQDLTHVESNLVSLLRRKDIPLACELIRDNEVELADITSRMSDVSFSQLLELLNPDLIVGDIFRIYSTIDNEVFKGFKVPALSSFIGDYGRVLQFLLDARRQRSTTLRKDVYERSLKIWASMNNVEKVQETLGEMHRARIQFETRHFNELLRALSQFSFSMMNPRDKESMERARSRANDAEDVVQRMTQMGLEPDVETHAFLMLCSAKAGRRSVVQFITRELWGLRLHKATNVPVNPSVQIPTEMFPFEGGLQKHKVILTAVVQSFLELKRVKSAAVALETLCQHWNVDLPRDSLSAILSEAVRLVQSDQAFKEERIPLIEGLWSWMNPSETMVARKGPQWPVYEMLSPDTDRPALQQTSLYITYLRELVNRQALFFLVNYMNTALVHVRDYRTFYDFSKAIRERSHDRIRQLHFDRDKRFASWLIRNVISGTGLANNASGPSSLEWERRIVPSVMRDWRFHLPAIVKYRSSGGLVELADATRLLGRMRQKNLE